MVEDSGSQSETPFQNEESPSENDVVFSVSGSPAVVVVERVSESEGDAEGYGESGIHAFFHGRHRQNAQQENGGDEGIPDLSDFIIRPCSPCGNESDGNEDAENGEFSKKEGIHGGDDFVPRKYT